MNILIYRDEGVGIHSYQHLLGALAELSHPKYAVKTVDHHFFLTQGWEASTALIAFPGGRDLPYHLKLQGAGNARIRSYVELGGRYLGICAGAYYGAAYIEFAKGEELEICGSRELAFFPGKAVGPAYGNSPFCYENDCRARTAQILWESGVTPVYFNGGCLFEEPESYSSTRVIARYNDLPNTPAAAIYCTFQAGAVILSGVHPEFNSKDPFFKYLINMILT